MTETLPANILTLPSPRGRTLVIGDIHGCYDETMDLLWQENFSSEDLLIAVGDVVDRGPGTLPLLRFFRDTPNAVTVLGNHERKLARVMAGTIQGAWSQLHAMESIPLDERRDWIDWMEALPIIIETPEMLVIHAMLDPNRKLDRQIREHVCGVIMKNRIEIPRNEEGVPLWFYPWAEIHGTKKPICMGHVEYPRIELVPGALYALDGNAVMGGELTALLLPEKRILTWPVRVNHKAASLDSWRRRLLKQMDPRISRIREFTTIQELNSPTAEEITALTHYTEFLTCLRLEERLNAIRKAIRHRFGDRPAPGPRRGIWTREIREILCPLSPTLLKILLSENSDPANRLLVANQDATLSFVDSAVRQLESVFDLPHERKHEGIS